MAAHHQPGETIYDASGNLVAIAGFDGAEFTTDSFPDFVRRNLYDSIVGNRTPTREEYRPMKEEPAFVRAICQAPAENTPRLLYADWFEEMGYEVDPKYRGAYLARAELIRLQIAVHLEPDCPVCHKTGRFRGTHQAWCHHMGIDVAATDLPPNRQVNQECVKCDSYARQHRVRYLLDTKYTVEPTAGRRAVKRGDEVRVEGKELWRPSELMTAREVRYVRGFVGIASFHTPTYFNLGAEAVKAAPLEMIVLSDRPIRENVQPFGRIGYFWAPYNPIEVRNDSGQTVSRFDTFNYPNCVLPLPLWELAYELRDRDNAGTVHDAYRWVSYACLWRARREAGLPDWLPRSEAAPVFKPATPGVPSHWFDPIGDARPLTREAWANDPELFHLYAVERDPTLIHFKGLAAFLTPHAFGELDYVPDAGFMADTMAQYGMAGQAAAYT